MIPFETMEVTPAYLTQTNSNSFRPGEIADIIGVKFVRPAKSFRLRPCFYILYKDGISDFVAIEDSENYIIT